MNPGKLPLRGGLHDHLDALLEALHVALQGLQKICAAAALLRVEQKAVGLAFESFLLLRARFQAQAVSLQRMFLRLDALVRAPQKGLPVLFRLQKRLSFLLFLPAGFPKGLQPPLDFRNGGGSRRFGELIGRRLLGKPGKRLRTAVELPRLVLQRLLQRVHARGKRRERLLVFARLCLFLPDSRLFFGNLRGELCARRFGAGNLP